jgi:ribonuclease P/MRP protein subunit POP5
MKPLLPTLRENKRYIAYEVITATPLRRDVSNDLVDQLAKVLGAFGMADAGVLSISYDPQAQTGVLRVSTRSVRRVRAAMLMTGYLGRQRACIRTLGVSGILRKTRRFTDARMNGGK